jgi:putative ABC transport system permease protein
MLELKGIRKEYRTGELVQKALDGVDLTLRDNEFVCILGPSGSGKTTLLNIVGGLDRYDSGEMLIDGISTKKYKDRDWDTYRNHSIGFVFQSYNLIPHQNILSNVELSLTIAGISKSQRRQRAIQALEKVGLGDQIHKLPNQLSGGQMQRVAIARALVNDPRILLADEPTGALDSETSLQVMALLKEVANDRLVVMVTHNRELADQYATRIVSLRDGRVTDDTDPFDPFAVKEADSETVSEKQCPETEVKAKKTDRKAKMSFRTSFALSFSNLLTKKGRTILTSFAGSIGIIGIGLILAISIGVNSYIDNIQKETMTAYPLTIEQSSFDLYGMMDMASSGALYQRIADDGRVHANTFMQRGTNTFSASVKQNDLTLFKQYLENPESDIRQYLGENGVVYSYNLAFTVYSYDSEGNLVSSDAEAGVADTTETGNQISQLLSLRDQQMSILYGDYGAENFTELMRGSEPGTISKVLVDNYDLLYGRWPESYDEVILVVGSRNTLSLSTLYQLGFITAAQYEQIAQTYEDVSFSFEELCDHEFYLLANCDLYQDAGNGTFVMKGDDAQSAKAILDQAVKLRITGVVRFSGEDAANVTIDEAIGYTPLLTSYIIKHTAESAVIQAQLATPEINVLTGIPFNTEDESEKIRSVSSYAMSFIRNSGFKVSDLLTGVLNFDNDFYHLIMRAYSEYTGEMVPTPEYMQQIVAGKVDEMADSAIESLLAGILGSDALKGFVINFYDNNLASSYNANMEAFGQVSEDLPSSISIYTDSFEDKNNVLACLDDYNATVPEDQRITYTDYVALIASSVTQIVDVISYVLIAFVAVSLVVSCIMIGIITHISVLERTKEIGILRALGASKRNISQVFNAETVILGLFSGLIGVGVSALLTIPINKIIYALTDTVVHAHLPIKNALILVAISVIITMIGGLIPARKAARKDPVIALRTE